ncbi:MAG: diguanylate cyclase [Bacilli bacterium]|nr:diguanylate cyclase [Bacilli bacterium]
MKDKRKLIIIILSSIAVILLAFAIFSFLNDKNKLTKKEKTWISDNLTTVQNINIINNAKIFGDNGTGVFYDFIKDFQTEYRLEINPITFQQGEKVEGISFNAGNTISKNDTIFYEDHYVIIGKNDTIISSINTLLTNKIGILSTDSEYLNKYLSGVEFSLYESTDKLYEGFKNGEVSYVIAPNLRDIDYVLSNSYYILYHLSDIKYYYYFDGLKDDILSSVINKYFNNWKDKYFDQIFYSNEFDEFVTDLGLTEADVSKIRSVTYNYGFINQNPYEVITGGNFGGIVAVYLKQFSDFANIEFNFKKYTSPKKFTKAVVKGDIDLYYDYYTYSNKLTNIGSYEPINIDIIAPLESNITINSLDTLKEEVYVQKDSRIERYLKQNTKLNIKNYETQKGMVKLARKNKIIAIDSNMFDYYHTNKLKKYQSRYHMVVEDSYSFKVKNDESFIKLFKSYIRSLDPEVVKIEGLNNHRKTVQKGSILARIAQYIMVIFLFIAAFMVFFYKKGKHLKIAKKIKNEDKIKYIDLLTSLKNRNYLTENMEVWNNNKIYPQTMIVIDLNNIAYLNDTKGYEAGDHQITAMANILIKTQLDNSDIMRTNGNEFLVYLVGYQQKHVVNYIHKLNKELKKLPYEYGAAIGYSMITDDIKTIEDAINEALEDMKKQKAKIKEVKN